MTANTIEHFCTLFDNNFLPQGLCLLESLEKHARPFHLWILCMDVEVGKNIEKLRLENTTVISLTEIETPELLHVKKDRSRGEYCWTLTPFLPSLILEKNSGISRITYLDADLFFFDSPQILLSEMDENKKDVLITEHAFAPEYDQTESSGRFCVQFLTFRNTEGSKQVLAWWQARCLEWCFARHEDGKFGDQKYLDLWPTMFAKQVHIVAQVEKTLAPWNIRFFEKKLQAEGRVLTPIFYHFHGLRIIAPKKVKLFFGYKVGNGAAKYIYKEYVEALKRAYHVLEKSNISWPVLPEIKRNFFWLRNIKHFFIGTLKVVRI